jgi:hypothetical protein
VPFGAIAGRLRLVQPVEQSVAQALACVAQLCARLHKRGSKRFEGEANSPRNRSVRSLAHPSQTGSAIMNKNLYSTLALVLAGFVVGALSVGMQGYSPKNTAHGSDGVVTMNPTLVTQIQDAAQECGVYGLPGSPAAIAIHLGADGSPTKTTVESDLFGGDETESCILRGVAKLPVRQDVQRVILPVYQPEDSMLANR